MMLLRKIWVRRNKPKKKSRAEIIRGLLDEVTKCPHLSAALLKWKEGATQHNCGSNGIRLIFEGGCYPEVAASSAQRPEQILIFGPAGYEQFPVCRDEVYREQIVDCQPPLPGLPPGPSPESQSAHSSR